MYVEVIVCCVPRVEVKGARDSLNIDGPFCRGTFNLSMNTSPWNKDRIIGQKRPLQISHIWGIRIRLELEGKTRDLALFNIALDSKLRGCDLVKLKVSDVAYGSSKQSYGVATENR